MVNRLCTIHGRACGALLSLTSNRSPCFASNCSPKTASRRSTGFPTGSLSRWSCRKTGEDEELEIHFGKQLVKVQGRGLGNLIDALDEGRLKLMRSCPPDFNDKRPWIKELTVIGPVNQS